MYTYTYIYKNIHVCTHMYIPSDHLAILSCHQTNKGRRMEPLKKRYIFPLFPGKSQDNLPGILGRTAKLFFNFLFVFSSCFDIVVDITKREPCVQCTWILHCIFL